MAIRKTVLYIFIGFSWLNQCGLTKQDYYFACTEYKRKTNQALIQVLYRDKSKPSGNWWTLFQSGPRTCFIWHSCFMISNSIFNWEDCSKMWFLSMEHLTNLGLVTTYQDAEVNLSSIMLRIYVPIWGYKPDHWSIWPDPGVSVCYHLVQLLIFYS